MTAISMHLISKWHFIADNARSKFVSLYSKVRLIRAISKILSVASTSEPAITAGGGNGRQSFEDSNRKQVGGTDTQFTEKDLYFGSHFSIGLRSGL